MIILIRTFLKLTKFSNFSLGSNQKIFLSLLIVYHALEINNLFRFIYLEFSHNTKHFFPKIKKEKLSVEKQRKTSSKKDYNSDTSVNSELQQQPSYNAAMAQKQAQFHYYQNLKQQQSNEQSVKLDSVNDLTDPTADQKRHSARLTNRRETISGAEMTTPTNSDRNGEQSPPHIPHKSDGDMPGTDIKIVIEREQSNDPASNFAHTFNQV